MKVPDDVWVEYEGRLSERDRACIADSPKTDLKLRFDRSNLWPHALELARHSEHMAVPHIAEKISRMGTKLANNSDAFGEAMRLAAFEIRNNTVGSWPAFALLFRKMLGDGAISWLPALYLGAHGLEATGDIPDLDDVLEFRNNYCS